MRLPPLGVLCGGVASRLGAVASTVPKSLVAVGGEPFLAHQLRSLAGQGFRKIVLMIGHRGDQIRAFVGDGHQFGVRVEYSEDGESRRGTGGAVRKALPLLGEHFFLTYGDSLLEFDPRPMWKGFLDSGALGMMAVLHNRDRWGRSNAVFDGERVLLHDKGVPALPGMDWIDWGMSVFAAEVMRNWPSPDPFDLATVTKHLAAARMLAGFEVKKRFYEIGGLNGLAETAAYLESLRSRRCK
jgi:MurNAc alpha-1-phosphate uridylyltransferase